MDSETLIKRMQPDWDELRRLVGRARRVGGARHLSAAELARLDRLYRVTMIHMAQVRSRVRNKALLDNLSRLVAQAHSVVYVAPKRQPLSRIPRFFATGFARAVARSGRFHIASCALFLIGVVCGSIVGVQHPEGAYSLFPAMETRLPGSSTEQLEYVLRSGRDQGGGEKLAFASFLLTHNTKVGFTACAAGIMCGVPTIFLMAYNGAMLGAFSTVHFQRGLGVELLAWLLPHGITELTAVILCGGAGLMLGAAVIRPGFRRRSEALVQGGREVMVLLLGVVPMFIGAGLVESFVRQSHLGTPARLLFALGTALFWVLYFANGRLLERRDERAPATDDSAP